MIGVYYQTWSCNWSSDPKKLDLAQIQKPVDIIYLSFANPESTYSPGSCKFQGSGLDFSSDFGVVQSCIGYLKWKGIKIMLSVGGASYAWNNVNFVSVCALARDLGCDGIDIDFEPLNGSLDSKHLIDIIKSFRIWWKGTLSLTGFSVGCYGYGKYINSRPQGQYNGMNYPALKECGNLLNYVNIMSYDCGTNFNAFEAFDSYRDIYKGPLNLGIELGEQAWGGAIITNNDIKNWCTYIKKDSNTNGIFIWSYQKTGTPNCLEVIKLTNDLLKKSFSNFNSLNTILHWSKDKAYDIGQLVVYEDKIYECLSHHESLEGVEPPKAIHLWVENSYLFK